VARQVAWANPASESGAMQRTISMWFGCAALLVAVSLGGPLTDLNDQLAEDTKKDAAAADNARCWCKKVKSVLDDRLRNSESEISELKTIKDSRFYENVGLHVQVKQHQKEIASNERSLQESNAIGNKASKSHASEKEETAQSLNSLRKALKIVPKGNEVHGVLKGLQDNFARKLEESKKEHVRREAQFKDMNSAKAEMLKLARKGMNMKQRRLADGEVVIAQAKSDIAAYTGQREADWALRGSLKSVCGDIADAATKREKQRQDTVIAISELKAANAQKAAQKAMSKVMLLKAKSVTTGQARCAKMLQALGDSFQGDCSGARDRAEDTKKHAMENLAGSRKAAKDLMDLMEKSKKIQADMSKMLSNVFMNSHLATMKGQLKGAVKAKISTLGDTANADKKATPALFNAVRAKAQVSTQADMKVVTTLQMGAATAAKALVDAGKCK